MGSLVRSGTKLAVHPVELDRDALRESLQHAWGDDQGVLLGHAWDGVLWGQIHQGRLSLAADALPDRCPRLRPETLTDLRLFAPDRELRVWRVADSLRACLLVEQNGEAFVAFQDGHYQLIRSPGNAPSDAEFVPLRGLAGQLHHPPGRPVPGALTVRTYFAADTITGLAKAAENRLLGLVPWKEASS